MNAFPISLIDLSAIMIYEPEGRKRAVLLDGEGKAVSESSEPCHFPLFRAEMDRLREELHGLGHELTWMSTAAIYAVTPSNIWTRKETA